MEFTRYHYGHLFREVRSVTTRPLRPNDASERFRYRFVSKERFQEMIRNNEFLEWDTHTDEYYGTLPNDFYKAFESRRVALMKATSRGAAKMKEKEMMLGVDIRVVFLLPCNDAVLLKNLARRCAETGSMEDPHTELAAVRSYCEEMKRDIVPDAKIFLKGENYDFVSFFKMFYKNGVLLKPPSSV